MNDQQARLARLEARLEIEQLLVLYTLLIDDHDFAALGELFTEDASFGAPGRLHRGRQDIVENYRLRAAQYPISLHVVRGAVINFDGGDVADLARGRVSGFSEQAGGGHTVLTSFRYDDVYRRVDGRWRFRAREVRTLYALSHAELAAGGLGWELRNRWPHRPPAPADLPPQ
jgi:hypothetical protein